MLSLIQKYPLPVLVLSIGALALGAWQFSLLASMGVGGYVLTFFIALIFFLVYWWTYARQAETVFRAVLPLFLLALIAAPFHLWWNGGLVAAMLFYTLLPGVGMMLGLWALSGRSLEQG
jgi:hypothetical protein